MRDITLLASVLNKDIFDVIEPHIHDKIVDKETVRALALMKEYYKLSKLSTISIPDFKDYMLVTQPPAQHKLINEMALAIQNEVITGSVSLKGELIDHYLKLNLALDLRNVAEDYILGMPKADIDKAEILITACKKSLASNTSKDTSLFVSTDLAGLIENTLGAAGLNWRLPELNTIFGPLRKGDLLLVAARPETGKTTLLASEVSHMATQLPIDKPVLWLCNEEQGTRIQLRVYQATLGWTKAEMTDDKVKTEKELTAVLGDMEKVKVLFDAALSVSQVNTICEQINPGLIIIDQLDKVQGMKAERQDLVYKALYQWARGLAARYGPVIAVCQADASAEGKKWLTQDQLDGSKTAKQGEVDAILMIGKSHDPSEEFKRFISAPKNKLSGGSLSLESMRHGRAEVTIDPERARYK